MYCSNCGTKVGGNFCSACGVKIQASAEPESLPSEPLGDWTDEIVYENLLKHVEVRDRIAKAAQRCPDRISGEDIMKWYDAIEPTGVPVGKLVMGMVPIMDRIGLNTGKRSEFRFQAPAGRTIVAVLCALAGQGYEIQKVDQLEDGCVLTSLLPSTLWTYKGELVVSLQRNQQSMQIQAATKIAGQLIDWGRSKRILRELFDDVRNELPRKRPPALPPRNVA